MKKFCAKIIVRVKPNVKDIKGLNLKRAIESFMEIKNLNCKVGHFYLLKFEANSEGEALHKIEKIASEILSNELMEAYEIKSLEEIYNGDICE